MMIYLGRERGGMSLKELGKRVGLKESSVSQTAGRVSRFRQENKEWDRALLKIEQNLIHNS
jgi:transcriptional regulator with XRE-family HTH domain